LYELITGTRAFTGDSTAQILSAVLRDDPGPFEAPAALQQIVRRCLAKDPDRRFQTMAEVRHALQHLTPGSGDVTVSIAVLPFANLSADRENEYFGGGLAEDDRRARSLCTFVRQDVNRRALAGSSPLARTRGAFETASDGVVNGQQGTPPSCAVNNQLRK
jgi:hypothetical protein